MNKQKEKEVVLKMIDIYASHKKVNLNDLKEYCIQRIDHCPNKEKTFCSSCKIHCYRKDIREQIRMVMRYSGKWMMLYHPFITINHMVNTLKEKFK